MRFEPLGMSASITIPRDKYQAKFGAALAAVAGGFTLSDAYGAWQDAGGYIIHEPVHILTAYYASDKDADVSRVIGNIANDLFDAGEQAVLVQSTEPVRIGNAIIHKE